MIIFYDHFGFIPLCGPVASFFSQNGPLFGYGSGHKFQLELEAVEPCLIARSTAKAGNVEKTDKGRIRQS